MRPRRRRAVGALLRWTTLAGVLTTPQAGALAREAAARPAAGAAVLVRARRLREAMYRLFRAAAEGWPAPPENVATFNRELQRARAHERLVAVPRFRWVWEPSRKALDRGLWPVVRSAADLLTGPELARVRRCPGERCGWLFLDTSRSRRRQWCDMAECGNLAKVRRFRQKHHPTR